VQKYLNRSDLDLGGRKEVYTVSQKKQSTIMLSITSPNVDRFSKFVHRQIGQWMCNKIVNYYPTTP